MDCFAERSTRDYFFDFVEIRNLSVSEHAPQVFDRQVKSEMNVVKAKFCA